MKDVDIQVTTSTVQNGYDVVIYNEDYTLGTIMQYLLYSAHYEGDKQMTYVGFKSFILIMTILLLELDIRNQLRSQLSQHILLSR